MKTSIKRLAAAILMSAVSLLTLSVPTADAIPSRPSPPRLVNDLAGLFTPHQAAELERILVSFDDTTSNQIAVVTTPDLEGYEIGEYAVRIGLDWQVGSEKFDNGLVIVVKPKTASSRGDVSIAVGYGLEGSIPDAYCSRIINEVMIPQFKVNDYAGGIYAACDILMKLASGEISELRERNDDDDISVFAVFLMFLIIFSIIVIIALGSNNDNNNNGRTGRRDGPIIFTSGTPYGGWGSSHGGRSFGGGGSFGGFGGFGGGSFGGGGASGSW